ncbi:kinase-like domain-containing protein [Scheffersomyces amazonensis]|uniref:kinase-like domain-containing protein n=1 Tax=Scheffersomyces amazonensis TaxID=1078765 RepID=UPI00315CF428
MHLAGNIMLSKGSLVKSHPISPVPPSALPSSSSSSSSQLDPLQTITSLPESISMSSKPSDFIFDYCIGTGNFGDVYKARRKDSNTIFAIKVIDLDESIDDINQLTQEIHLLSRLRSPYITNYFESFIYQWNMYIVMEYCGGGSCSDLLKLYKHVPEMIVSFILREVLKGLQYLHSEHKVHRDIKSANILLTEKAEVKLADFGVSGEMSMTHIKKKTFVGTPFWMAPEVIIRGDKNKREENESKDDGYDSKVDIWSTGITAIELVTGRPPLSQYNPFKILFQIPKITPPTLEGVQYSDNIKDFVRYCLIKEPSFRPSASILLKHHFITRGRRNAASAQNQLFLMISKKNDYLRRHGKLERTPNHLIYEEEQNSLATNAVEWNFQTMTGLPAYSDLGPQVLNKTPKVIVRELPKKNIDPMVRTDHVQVQVQSSSPIQINGQEVLFGCLENLYRRAMTEGAKSDIASLMSDFHRYETQQPGLCDALVEEFLHVPYKV